MDSEKNKYILCPFCKMMNLETTVCIFCQNEIPPKCDLTVLPKDNNVFNLTGLNSTLPLHSQRPSNKKDIHLIKGRMPKRVSSKDEKNEMVQSNEVKYGIFELQQKVVHPLMIDMNEALKKNKLKFLHELNKGEHDSASKEKLKDTDSPTEQIGACSSGIKGKYAPAASNSQDFNTSIKDCDMNKSDSETNVPFPSTSVQVPPTARPVAPKDDPDGEPTLS